MGISLECFIEFREGENWGLLVADNVPFSPFIERDREFFDSLWNVIPERRGFPMDTTFDMNSPDAGVYDTKLSTWLVLDEILHFDWRSSAQESIQLWTHILPTMLIMGRKYGNANVRLILGFFQ